MTDRSVITRLILDLSGFTPNTVEASKSASALATAQKETAAAARDAGVAQRESAAAAKDAAATASAAAKAQAAAQKEATAAAKEAAATEVAASKAVGDAERADAEAAAQVAAERAAAAKEALSAATTEAEATAKTAEAARAGATESAKYAAAQREVAAAAKEAAGVESDAAKQSAAAAAERADAYKASGTAMTTMALGTGAAIGLMVKDAGDFQSATAHLVTDAGESQANLAMVQAGILKTAAATGTASTQLVDAMYHIESAGYHGADGLKLLTTAAQGAKVGGADLGVVAKTLTGTMNSYNMTGDQSVSMMNQLIATVGAGDMKMNDLAGSLGSVTPIAASAGIKFSEVGAAIATMTSQNMSADRATQDLAHTIGALQKPNNIQIAQMQQLGLDSNDVSNNLGKKGLTGTLEMLTTAVAQHTQNGQVFIDTLKSSQNAAADADTMFKQLPPSIQSIAKQLMDGTISAAEYNKGIAGLDAPQQHLAKQFEALIKSSGSFNDLLKSGKPEAETFNAAMSNLLGGATGLNTALMLTGGRMQTFKDNAALIQDAANKGGTEVDNWGKIQQTFNQKIDVAKASLGAMGIAIGTTLLPAIADLAKWITSIVTPIAEWVDKHQGLTAAILGSGLALAALVLAIKAIQKTADLFKTAINGITTAVGFFTKSTEAATVKTEELAVQNAAAAKEAEAAAVSTGSFAGKLGASLPVIGAVVIGAQALGGWLNKLADGGSKAGASVDQWTTALLSASASAGAFGVNADEAQKAVDAFGGKANAAIEPTAAIGVELAKAGQMMGKGADVVKNYDGALAAMASSGHADRAAALMAQITSATDKQGHALIDTQKDFPQYWAALDKNAANQALSANATTGATAALGANSAALGDNAAAAVAGADAAATAAAGSDTAATASTAQATAATYSATTAFQAAGAARALADAQAALKDKTDAGTAAHKEGTAALKAISDAEANAAGSAKALDSSVTDEVNAMREAKDKASGLSDALNALNGVHIAASKAALDVQQKVSDLTQAMKDNGKTTDITTEAGRKNMSAVLDLASAINAHAQAVTEETGSVDAGNKALDANRTQFDAVLKAAGLSKDQIDNFNKSLLNTPKVASVTLKVGADTSEATAVLQQLEAKYGGTGLVFGGHHVVPGYASGGLVVGRGTGTSDSNLIAVSDREYIFDAASVARIGVDKLEALQYGTGSAAVVKPSIPMRPLPSSAAASSSAGAPALNIENYFENGNSPATVATELGWLLKARGGQL